MESVPEKAKFLAEEKTLRKEGAFKYQGLQVIHNQSTIAGMYVAWNKLHNPLPHGLGRFEFIQRKTEGKKELSGAAHRKLSD